jgi:hypothetical protein
MKNDALFIKNEMNSVHQSALTIQKGLEALIKDFLKSDMDFVMTRAAGLRDQAQWMEAVLFIMLHGCNNFGGTYWTRPEPRLLCSIGSCWVLLNRVQDQLDKICHESVETQATQINILNLIADWYHFCIALIKSRNDLRQDFRTEIKNQVIVSL